MVKQLVISNLIVIKTSSKWHQTTQPIYENLQRCRQKFMRKIRQNFRESTLENSLIVHGDTKKDKFTLMKRYGTHYKQSYRTNFNRCRAMCINWVRLWAFELPVWGKMPCLQCLLLFKRFTQARQFVEYFIKKWPQKRLFKTFNIEKNNRQTYCKQAVIWCVMPIISTKKRVLNDKNHHFACLPTCLCRAKAYTLGTSSNAFGRKAHDFREPIIGESS